MARTCLAMCMLAIALPLVNVRADDLRVRWFVIHIPACCLLPATCYLQLGRRAGLGVTLATWARGTDFVNLKTFPHAAPMGSSQAPINGVATPWVASVG